MNRNALTAAGPRLRVFIVEDETIVAMLIEEFVRELGWEVAGLAASVEAALAALERTDADVVILDVNLQGTKSFPVAEFLQARRLPFAFATAYGRPGLEGRFENVPLVRKPYGQADLARVVGEALSASAPSH
jgi:CheY-like chemotaxis protein